MNQKLLLSVKLLKEKSNLLQLGSYFLPLAIISINYCRYIVLNKVIAETGECDMS